MIFTILLVAFAAIIIYIYGIKLYKYWERKGVKQKFPIPLIGDLKNIPLCELVNDIYNRFPNTRYVGFYQMTRPVLMLKDPELIKQICVKDFEHFLDHAPFLPEDSDPIWHKGLLSLKGQKWKEMRATLSPSFTGSKMRQIFVLMQECAENFTQYLAENSGEMLEIDLKDSFTRYANDIIATTIFGIKCDSLRERENQFYQYGKQATDFTRVWKHIKIMLVMTIPWLGKFVKASFFDEDVSTFFRKVVKDTMEYRDKNHIERPDMINLLMNARKEKQIDEEEQIEENNFAAVDEHFEIKPQKRKMDLTLDDITSQALIFFFAGFESVSTAMCFMALELAKNPDIQQRLIEELDDLRANSQMLKYESLSKLPYLDMVFSETLRKWPPSIAIDRVCVKPYTIKPKKPDEKPVDLGTEDSIWIPFWALHRNPEFWENPEKFDPERFSPENREKIIPYTYLPFGVGPRNCIGSRFAILEVKIVFYYLLEHFEIVPIKKSPIPFVPNKRSFILNSENGFWFGLKKRTNANTKI